MSSLNWDSYLGPQASLDEDVPAELQWLLELTTAAKLKIDCKTEKLTKFFNFPVGMYGLPKRSGKVKNLTNFDASFFGVHPKQANSMDPQLRKLLEVVYEAIVDAGKRLFLEIPSGIKVHGILIGMGKFSFCG